jgi:hypothetical protein
MGSGAVIYVPSFTEIGSGIQKLIKGGEYTDTFKLNFYPEKGGDMVLYTQNMAVHSASNLGVNVPDPSAKNAM